MSPVDRAGSETGLKFLISTQSKIHPGNRASPVNRAHMKRPSVSLTVKVLFPELTVFR